MTHEDQLDRYGRSRLAAVNPLRGVWVTDLSEPVINPDRHEAIAPASGPDESDADGPKPRHATATYCTVKVGLRGTRRRYRAVIRGIDGSTTRIGKTEYYTKGDAVAAAQDHLDSRAMQMTPGKGHSAARDPE